MRGSCLCGEVEYAVEPPFKLFQYCHCSRCRKLTGSAHAANVFVSVTQFSWLRGAERVKRYDHTQAKYFSSAFCSACGSSLPWVVKGGKDVVVPAGTLDQDPHIKPVHNVYWGSKAPWCLETSEIPKHLELPERK